MNNRTAVTIDLLKDVLVAAADVSFYFNQTDRRQAVNSYTYYTGPTVRANAPRARLRRALLQPARKSLRAPR